MAVKSSGGTPATTSSRKSSGWRDVVGAAGGDVDRHVADQAHAALVGVVAQRVHSRSKRTWSLTARVAAGEAAQSSIQTVALTEGVDLVGRHRRVRVGEQPAPGRECRRALYGEP